MDEHKKRQIILLSGGLTLAIIAGVIAFLLMGNSDEPKDVTLTAAERTAAQEAVEELVAVSGNYGASEALMELPEQAMGVDLSVNPEFKSRNSAYVAALPFLSTKSSYRNNPEVEEQAFGNPYSVTTNIKTITVKEKGFELESSEAVIVEVTLESTLSFLTSSQGFLADDGTPIVPKIYKGVQNFSDSGNVVLVKESGTWKVKELNELDKIKTLAFQDHFGFHDTAVVGLPEPSSNKLDEIGPLK